MAHRIEREGIVGDGSKILRAGRCFCVCVIKMRRLSLGTENLVKLFVCLVIIYINAILIKIHLTDYMNTFITTNFKIDETFFPLSTSLLFKNHKIVLTNLLELQSSKQKHIL